MILATTTILPHHTDDTNNKIREKLDKATAGNTQFCNKKSKYLIIKDIKNTDIFIMKYNLVIV